MKLNENKDVQDFLRNILEQVKFQQAHEEIKLEYLNHIEESAKLGASYGLNTEDSITDAIHRLGKPIEIGNQLNQIHAPKIDLAIAFSILTLCLIGLYSLSSLGFATAQSVWMTLGLFVAAFFIFAKPTQLIRISSVLYGFTILVIGASYFSGVTYLGQPYLAIGPLNIKIVDLSTVLFLISSAGLIFRIPKKSKLRIPLILCLSLLPLAYYSYVNSVFPGILYFASTLALLASAKISWKSLTAFITIGLLTLAAATDTESFLTSESFTLLQQTEAHTDFIFHHMISKTPVAALLTLLAFGLLVARSITMSNEIKNQFSAALFNASLVMITLGALWGFASGLGYIPMPQTGVNVPFVSYGGSLLVAHLALIGILLGLIRRKSLHFN